MTESVLPKKLDGLEKLLKDGQTLRKSLNAYNKQDSNFIQLNGVQRIISDLDQLERMISLEIQMNKTGFKEAV